jgi:glutathione synthase/RimK-type ligase-like ATP-grasp enzyme
MMALMSSVDFVLLTDERYEQPVLVNDYVTNLLQEDRYLEQALKDLGYQTQRVAWSNPTFDWSQAKAVVLRTPWDYFEKFPAFSVWLEKVSKVTQVINSPDLLWWNMDKIYFKDLIQRGVVLPETQFYPRGASLDIKTELTRLGWAEGVLKPTISGAARHTYRVNTANADEIAAKVAPLASTEAFMLQPFIPSVLSRGEVSLMYFGGQYTHAVRKVARSGDFRVQDDHGGTVVPYEKPRADEFRLAEQALRACPQAPVYARVDLVDGPDGQPLLMELEVVEPELFLRYHPSAAKVFAQALVTGLI